MEEKRAASYGWLRATKWRMLVVLAMDEDELNPTLIVKRVKRYDCCITLSTLNRVLKELMMAGVVVCADTSLYRGRPYTLTSLGLAFRERLLVDSDYGLEAIRREAIAKLQDPSISDS